MTTKKRELTGLDVSRLESAGVYAVGGVRGLYLQIVGNSRVWVLRTMIGGKRRRMGLGSYPTVTLTQARERAREAYNLIYEGIDPIENRKQQAIGLALKKARAVTFAQACDRYIKTKEHEWTNEKHRGQWEATLTTYAYPVIGQLSTSEVTQEHIMQILQPIWLSKTETAQRLRGRIESVLDWATVSKLREGENPARWKGRLDILLPKPSKITKVRHHPALDYTEVPNALAKISEVKGISGKALMFLILTAARTGETLGAQWSEIDIESAVWMLPASRMKAGRSHRVPLSKQAVELILNLPCEARSGYVFESQSGGMLSNMAMLTTMRRLKFVNKAGDNVVPHGFRSSFRDWCADYAHVPRDVAEMALAHTIESKTEAAYRRGDMLDRRAPLMQKWADYCFN